MRDFEIIDKYFTQYIQFLKYFYRNTPKNLYKMSLSFLRQFF